jgi:XTP/dITP diphosphohydrolase
MPRLLLATGNKHKLQELKSLLRDLPYDIVSPVDVGIDIDVVETSSNLEENAALKAKQAALDSHLLTLADDSGLEVDALNGAPGVLSARYAGENATDAERIGYLLSQLEDVPWDKRRAKFRCVIAIATPEGVVELCHGECRGYIAFQPAGEQGFGYDPIFYLPELRKTMAELPFKIKNRISHRGLAVVSALSFLLKIKSEDFDC